MTIPKPISKQPTPKHAKKVFQGKVYSIYQWQQELFDKTTTTFERIHQGQTVNILSVTKDKKIILTKQQQPGMKPFIGTVGGVVDPEEKVEQAARRELLEETGYQAKKLDLWFSDQPFSKIEWEIYTFIAKGCTQVSEQNLDAGEKIELIFATFDEFMQIISDEKFRDSEVALKILRLKANPNKFQKFKQLLIG